MEFVPADLRQAWPRASAPRPIVVIGAGSIVRDAHLPVYARMGYPVAGIFDLDTDAAHQRAEQFALGRVFNSLEEALQPDGVVFDVAVPPQAIIGILERMPGSASVLIQKPMGQDLGEARRIQDICRGKKLTAAINFQLRFAPNMLALQDAITRGVLGDITDIEVRINLHTPWSYWPFAKGVPRLEILMHSIHYIDLIRKLVGEPHRAYARAVQYPGMEEYADGRSSIILDFGDMLRCSLTMNHTHEFGPRRAVSEIRVEGTKAAAVARMGVNLNYPHGEPDELEFCARDSSEWVSTALRGSWFLEAFEGPMSNLQRVVAGEDGGLISPVDDAFHTMAIVEACYESSASGGTPIAKE